MFSGMRGGKGKAVAAPPGRNTRQASRLQLIDEDEELVNTSQPVPTIGTGATPSHSSQEVMPIVTPTEPIVATVATTVAAAATPASPPPPIVPPAITTAVISPISIAPGAGFTVSSASSSAGHSSSSSPLTPSSRHPDSTNPPVSATTTAPFPIAPTPPVSTIPSSSDGRPSYRPRPPRGVPGTSSSTRASRGAARLPTGRGQGSSAPSLSSTPSSVGHSADAPPADGKQFCWPDAKGKLVNSNLLFFVYR